MRAFTNLTDALDQARDEQRKIGDLSAYWGTVPDPDKLWTMALLSGKSLSRTIPMKTLSAWVATTTDLPSWMYEASCEMIGNGAESIALLLPKPIHDNTRSLAAWIDAIAALKDATVPEIKQAVSEAWLCLTFQERFIFNALLAGTFRMQVSATILTQSLANHTSLDVDVLAYRLAGDWTPANCTFDQLVHQPLDDDALSKPFAFYRLPIDVQHDPRLRGEAENWQVSYLSEGICCQLIVRQQKLYIWSKDGAVLTDRFPEFQTLAQVIPDGLVMLGMVQAQKDQKTLPLSALSARIQRKVISKKIRTETPVVFIGIDLLEYQGSDLRSQPFAHRQVLLLNLIDQLDDRTYTLPNVFSFTSWAAIEQTRQNARAHRCQGIVLRNIHAHYDDANHQQNAYVWPSDPLTVNVVLVYTHQGPASGTYLSYTFAVWQGDDLVPITKAPFHLPDEDVDTINAFIRANIVERFGPVRTIKPDLTFRLAFDGIRASKRHKSGLVLEGAHVVQWLSGTLLEEAGNLADLTLLLDGGQQTDGDIAPRRT